MKAPHWIPDRAATRLLREAQEWRLIALLLERPRGTWWREVVELAQHDPDPDLARAAEHAVAADEGQYLALLGPGGTVSAREAGYRRTTDPAQILAQLGAYYGAFAYQPKTEDPLDHVAVEAGFVGWMRLKQAFALANGDTEAAAVTREAADKFVREHLAACAEPLREKLAARDDGHLAAAAKALLQRTGARPKDLEGDWLPEGLGVTECSLSCGLGGGEAEGDEIPPEFTAGLPREP